MDSELHRAATTGHLPALLMALKAHPDALNQRNRRGMAPLHVAADAGYHCAVRLLLEAGADVAAKEGDTDGTALHLACTAGHASCVETLLDAGAAVDARDGDGWTPLAHAAYYGHEACLALLLAAGADLEAADACGRTPLMQAAAESDVCVAALLAAGARADVADQAGDTPLLRAAVSQPLASRAGARLSLAAIHALVAAGAPLSVRDGQGRTPAEAAEAAGCAAAAQLLRDLQRQQQGSGDAPDGQLGVQLPPGLEAAEGAATSSGAVFGPELQGRCIRVWWQERQEWVEGRVLDYFAADSVHVVEFPSVNPRMQLQRVRLRHERVQLLGEDGAAKCQPRCGTQAPADGEEQLAAAMGDLRC